MGNIPKCSNTHASLNHMLKLWGVKINKDDLAQYKDTIVEHNPLLPEKKSELLRIVSKYKEL